MPDKEATAQPDPVTIGQLLRKQREERGLTPEQAAYQSKVPLRLLQALEADDYRMLPDPAYLTRLLHEYALLLRLDPNALEAEFRSAIRRPPRTSLAMTPSKPAPAPIPWKHVLWTAAAILAVTPLVFIALSLASKRAADRPASPPVVERPEEQPTPERAGLPTPESLSSVRPEGFQLEPPTGMTGTPAMPKVGPEAEGPTRDLLSGPPPLPQAERKPRRFLLAAHAVEDTWMAVRADDGQERQVLLQKGQTARFVADMRFLVTVGNAGGVELSLNGKPMPSLGPSGQVIRDLVIPSATRDSETPGGSSPGAAIDR
jgi:cytoskeleton protein RodZ